MPPITALLHILNDESRIGRALETLRSCDEILVIDHGSTDQGVRIARQYGALIGQTETMASAVELATCPWILCLLPTESVSEALESSLYEWKLYAESDVAQIAACSAFIREETESGWGEPVPETRLVRRDCNQWNGRLPMEMRTSMLLQGDLLRFRAP
jgi:glycosyltransferase involved in cell wall biosynthesis